MGDYVYSWNFESLDEIQQFTITNKKEQGDIIEYDVDMVLHDKSGNFRIKGLIVYKKVDGKWQIASMTMKEHTKI